MVIGLARPLPNGVGRVTQGFGVNRDKYLAIPNLREGHNGLDYGNLTPKDLVLAMHDGIVQRGYDANGYGNYIKLIGTQQTTIYAHLSLYAAADGVAVTTGTLLGFPGNTGWSTGLHLHIDWRVAGVSNPGYLDRLNPLLGRMLYDSGLRNATDLATYG